MNLYSFFQKYRSRIILAAIIIFSGFLLLYKLNNQDITLWDESIHINIVKNLTTHCCIPILHKQDFGLDFRGWDNNYIWMHKPIFPFYLNALIYSLFGKTLLGYRMLGYLAALATATGLYLIGKKFFSTTVGVVAAILFVANPFTNSLVHEFQFSGFVDLTFTAFLLGSLYYLFKIADSPKRKYFLLFALFGSLAFYCKSGLVFGAYLTLAVLSIRLGTKKNFLSFLYSILLTLIVISPEYIVLSHMFPVEFSYEEAQYLGHFGEALEYWGRPWDYYLTYYFSGISGVLLAGYSWLIILISFIKSKANIYIFILLVWILAYIVPVSFAETKISNFIFPILPALCLLIAAVSRLLWNELKYRQVFIYTGAVALLYFCLRFDLFGI